MKWTLRRDVIKESFDHLPSGICFADRHGVIILCNHQMYRLFQILARTDLQHIFELHRALSKPEPEVTPLEQVDFVFRFPGGQVWKFQESTVTDAIGVVYTQVQAFDLTTLYEKKSELETQNRQLKAVNQRAKRLYMELDEIIREEETFAMKMSVHNTIGLRLLSTHKALGSGFNLSQLRAVGTQWRQTIENGGIIKKDADYPDPKLNPGTSAANDLQDLISTAEEIGLDIVRSTA